MLVRGTEPTKGPTQSPWPQGTRLSPHLLTATSLWPGWNAEKGLSLEGAMKAMGQVRSAGTVQVCGAEVQLQRLVWCCRNWKKLGAVIPVHRDAGDCGWEWL